MAKVKKLVKLVLHFIKKDTPGTHQDSIELFLQLCFAELGQIPLPEEFIKLT